MGTDKVILLKCKLDFVASCVRFFDFFFKLFLTFCYKIITLIHTSFPPRKKHYRKVVKKNFPRI